MAKYTKADIPNLDIDTLFKIGMSLANKIIGNKLGGMTWDDLPDINALWDHISEGMSGDDFIQGVKDAVDERLSEMEDDMDLFEGKRMVQITRDHLKRIINEGVAKLHRQTLIENRIREISEELKNLSENNEVASSEVMEILNSYVEAILWTEEVEMGHLSIEEVSSNLKIDAYKDVKEFLRQAGNLVDGIEPSQIGHDLWLTRQGHGAGFWDRGLGEVGDKLSDIAKGMGEKSVYIGDDGEIYVD